VEKTDKILQEWIGFSKDVLAMEKDKVYFRSLKNLSDAISTKLDTDCKSLSGECQDQMHASMKILGLMVSITKMYKAWVKKGDDKVFREERVRLSGALPLQDNTNCLRCSFFELRNPSGPSGPSPIKPVFVLPATFAGRVGESAGAVCF
jgi:hypothetical protein